VRLAAGTFFFREGQACCSFALIQRGEIRVFKTGRTGREITLYHVEKGQPCLVNMLSVFLGQPAMASAVVETAAEALTVPAAAFRRWVHESDAARQFVFETMAARLLDVTMLVEEVAFERMDRRLAQLLLRKLTQREPPLRVLPTTHEELAAELGTAREVVSRVLKEFERHGAISLSRRHVELRDARVLQQLART
jgi:CRP/FNR family transcriptional regulator